MKAVPKRLLLFAATTGYQIREFENAARRLELALTLATDHCDRLGDAWGDGALAVKFDHRMMKSLEILRGLSVDGIAAVGDRPAVAAAHAAEMLGVPFHSVPAANACHDKYLARQLYQAAGLLTPWFWRASLRDDAGELSRRAEYPCVLKPLGLSGSRGVIRANDAAEFQAAFRRIAKIGEKQIQVERYIPGREFAVEGIVTRGSFRVLAIFDKPDPLDGPYFEESIYVTPSREPEAVQQQMSAAVERAARALGLAHGPVHAELRHNREGVWMLEMHARPIGGLCARALRFQDGMPLEELILRHAVGEEVAAVPLMPGASGVMMIPIPKSGIFESVAGVAEAAAVGGIEDVVITAAEGQRLVQLPEGASYLGFIFARRPSPQAAEASLREAHARLKFQIATVLETLSPWS